MFEDKEAAIQVNKDMLAVIALLNDSLISVQSSATQDEFQNYRREVGKLMGAIFFEVLDDVWEKYPDLKPESFRDD